MVIEKYILDVPKKAAEKLGLAYDKKRRRWYCTKEHPKFEQLGRFLLEVVTEEDTEEASDTNCLPENTSESTVVAPVPKEGASVECNQISQDMKELLSELERRNIVPTVPQSVWHNMTERQIAYAKQFGGVINENRCAFKDNYSAQLFALWMKREIPFAGAELTESHRVPEDSVVIDVGTSGTEEDDDIVEMSILDMCGRELFHSFFKPTCSMSVGASRVNLLTDIGLSLEPLLMEKWNEIVNILADAPQIYSYGAEFDTKMLAHFLEKNGNAIRVNEFKVLSAKIRDVRAIAEERFGGHVSLKSAVSFLGLPSHDMFSTSWNAYEALLVLRKLNDEPVAAKGSDAAPKMKTIRIKGIDEMQAALNELFAAGGRYIGHVQINEDILLIVEN